MPGQRYFCLTPKILFHCRARKLFKIQSRYTFQQFIQNEQQDTNFRKKVALLLILKAVFFFSWMLYSALSKGWWYLCFYQRQTKVAMASRLKRRRKYQQELMFMSTRALNWNFLSSFAILKCHLAYNNKVLHIDIDFQM